MSQRRSFQLNCSCGHEFEATLWDAIDVAEEQELKQKLISGHINQIHCEKCQKRSYVEKDLVYHDMDQRLWVQMFPKADRPKWSELEEDHKEALKNNPLIRRYHFRLAFGRDELLEKIRIFDNQLDDRVIELMKCKMLEQDESIKQLLDSEITFLQYISEKGEIHFKLVSHEKNIFQTLVVPFEHYEDIEENKEHIERKTSQTKLVCQGIYISMNKTRVFH